MALPAQLRYATALALLLLHVATASGGLRQSVFDCFGTGDVVTTDQRSIQAAPAWVQRAWCCRHRGLGCVAGARSQTLEGAGFAMLALASTDHEPHNDRPEELAVQAGQVLWVRKSTVGPWAFAISKHGGSGWVPSGVLSFARPAAVCSHFTASSQTSSNHPQPQISAKLGDAVWIVEKSRHRHLTNWSWVYGDKQEGWLPNWALQVHADDTLMNVAPAMVSRDFTADARIQHEQLSVSKGDMVLAGGKLKSTAWVFALDMDGRHRGWTPGSDLQPLQAAVVLESWDARAVSEGPQPRLPVFQGHTVWVSSRNVSGWSFARSKGREGWIPTGALLGNTMLFSNEAGVVHTRFLAVGLVGLMFAVCVIAAVFAYDASLRQSLTATLQTNSPDGEVLLAHADCNSDCEETQERQLVQVVVAPPSDFSDPATSSRSSVLSSHSMGSQNSTQSGGSLCACCDSQPLGVAGLQVGSWTSTSRSRQAALCHEAVQAPRSKSL